jgi:hypothetical protein
LNFEEFCKINSKKFLNVLKLYHFLNFSIEPTEEADRILAMTSPTLIVCHHTLVPGLLQLQSDANEVNDRPREEERQGIALV